MKNKRGLISTIISSIIIVVIFAWSLFYNWGIPYFQKHFSFSGMILPCIVAFFIFWACIYAILSAILHIKEHGIKNDFVFTQESNENTYTSLSAVRCPQCGSESISADKKGFGVGKAVIGAAVAGPIGLTAGNIGAKKVRITCLKCGHQWMAGKG